MTNTQEAFENTLHNICDNLRDDGKDADIGEYVNRIIQACQAHNDAVIAELREDFLDLRKQVNYRCADVQRLTELNIELVEALIEVRKVIDDNLPTRLGQSSKDKIDELIAKHKKV